MRSVNLVNKMPFEYFEKMMSFDVVANDACIEVNFSVDDSFEYNSCWLGKMPCNNTSQELYWYGLVSDGTQAYDYSNLTNFINAPIFHNKNIKEVWHLVTFHSIDGCDVDWRIAHYLGLEDGPSRGSSKPI